MSEERARLEAARTKRVPWRKWGPYLSERQWGTVREDYSANGDAWDYFTHDQARSRAYHWGEDGLAGSPTTSSVCASPSRCGTAKIRSSRSGCSGSPNNEGNHGEDVKEYYFYLDSTPTHSYMKMLYKYPQARVSLRGTGARRNVGGPARSSEYELLDTGMFEEDRYFDVFVEYAKTAPEDILIRITRREPRARDRDAARAADPVVPKHMDVVAATGSRRCARSNGPKRTRVIAARAREIWAALAVRRGRRPRSCSPRTRRTRAAVRHPERDPVTSRTRSTNASCTETGAP